MSIVAGDVMGVQMTLDEEKNRALRELLKKRDELSKRISELHKELMHIEKKIMSLDDKRWGHIYEDDLLDAELIRMVGDLHFADFEWGIGYEILDTKRHIYVGRDKYEVDAVVAYRLVGGTVRSVGFELKLNNNYYSLSKAISQALDRYKYFDYFYVVFGGRFMSGAFENAVDMLQTMKHYGIGLVIRPTDIHVKNMGSPVILLRARMNRNKKDQSSG